MKKPLHSQYYLLLRKFRKSLRKYRRQLDSGRFETFSPNKRSRILDRLKRMLHRLNEMNPKLRAGLASMAILAGVSTSATAQNFVQVTGAGNPLDGFSFCGDAHPVFVDIDGDGDLDGYVGDGYWLNHLENTGSAASANFIWGSGSVTTVNCASVNPAFVDIDGDNDYDLVIADEAIGYYFWEYINIGNSTTPNFQTPSGSSNAMGFHCGDAQPDFADIDGDNDFDFFWGTDVYNDVQFNTNSGNVNTAAWGSQSAIITTGNWTSPDLYDFDGDNDFDMFVGQLDGTIRYFENQGSASVPNFVELLGASNPFDGIDVGNRATPAVLDIDNDGTPEAFVGNQSGNVLFFDIPGGGGTPPTAGFVASDTTLCEGECVNFTDMSATSGTATYNWSFPGGTPATSTDQNPMNICYATSGTQTITLIVTDSVGSDTINHSLEVFDCTDLGAELSADQVDLFPNPAIGQVTIDVGSEIMDVRVLDALGREVEFWANITGNTIMDVSGLATGEYILRLSNDKGVLTKKLVIR